MKKYLSVAKNTWVETFTYRLNFVMWRFRVILQLLTIYFLWFAITIKSNNIFGYGQAQILTYILGTSLINSFVFASRTYSVGDEINEGVLSNYLVKPVNYFMYHFAKDLGDKAVNIVFSIAELTILFAILRPPLFLQTNPVLLLLAIASTLIALVLYFYLNFLIGLVGFWSPEIWAPRFIFMIVITFFAGGLFPLDILPAKIFAVFKILPFTYLLYFPLKIYLGQLAMSDIIIGMFVSLAWLICIYLVVKFVWMQGLKVYTAWGK